MDMNRTKRRIKLIAFITIQCALLSLVGTVLASNSAHWGPPPHEQYGNPVWTLEGVTVYLNSDGSESIQDFFGDVTKRMLPGVQEDLEISLVNDSSQAYRFFLHAEAQIIGDRTPEEVDELLGTIQDFFPGSNPMDSLLDEIEVTVSDSLSDRYIGSLAGTSYAALNNELGQPLANMYSEGGVSLGVIPAGGTRTIDVSLLASDNLSNDFQGALTTVFWWFTAEEVPGGPGGPDGPGGPSGPDYPSPETDDSVIIDLDPPPLVPGPDPDDGDGEDLIDIIDEETPRAEGPDIIVVVDPGENLPQTGGVTIFVTIAIIALMILSALLAMTYYLERKEQN